MGIDWLTDLAPLLVLSRHSYARSRACRGVCVCGV